ncbi:hypothetical protein [Marinomonas communis]|uniref:hypothetical protein n=1 Tax=Marinomonas communis TaxID=28254 RepID=UPI001D17F2EA|nr:hypothetical protein [Marinomonas communis]MCC4276133.1 hypothetical protein [Marinomonas communis]
MSNTKKVIREIETQTFNAETGEITNEISSKVVQLPTEPPFVKLYIEDIAALYQLPDGTHRVLVELLKKLDYEGKISLNKTNKLSICEKVGYKTVASLDNYLSKHLVKKGIFRKEGTGVFIPDPHLFGRGKWQDIYKQRQAWLKISYNENGERTVMSSLNEDE